MRLRRKPVGLVGGFCPVCRTVQSWMGDHILTARIFCNGRTLGGVEHPSEVVDVVSGWQA